VSTDLLITGTLFRDTELTIAGKKNIVLDKLLMPLAEFIDAMTEINGPMKLLVLL
jgi:hypothetical protein